MLIDIVSVDSPDLQDNCIMASYQMVTVEDNCYIACYHMVFHTGHIDILLPHNLRG